MEGDIPPNAYIALTALASSLSEGVAESVEV